MLSVANSLDQMTGHVKMLDKLGTLMQLTRYQQLAFARLNSCNSHLSSLTLL